MYREKKSVREIESWGREGGKVFLGERKKFTCSDTMMTVIFLWSSRYDKKYYERNKNCTEIKTDIFIVWYCVFVHVVLNLRCYTCDMIQRNESDVGHIVFEILAKTVFKFLCSILFLALSNLSQLCNQISNCNRVCIKIKVLRKWYKKIEIKIFDKRLISLDRVTYEIGKAVCH